MLDLDSGSEPIKGRIVVHNGDSVDFVGWLGLASALQRATRPGRPPTSDPSREERDE